MTTFGHIMTLTSSSLSPDAPKYEFGEILTSGL